MHTRAGASQILVIFLLLSVVLATGCDSKRTRVKMKGLSGDSEQYSIGPINKIVKADNTKELAYINASNFEKLVKTTLKDGKHYSEKAPQLKGDMMFHNKVTQKVGEKTVEAGFVVLLEDANKIEAGKGLFKTDQYKGIPIAIEKTFKYTSKGSDDSEVKSAFQVAIKELQSELTGQLDVVYGPPNELGDIVLDEKEQLSVRLLAIQRIGKDKISAYIPTLRKAVKNKEPELSIFASSHLLYSLKDKDSIPIIEAAIEKHLNTISQSDFNNLLSGIAKLNDSNSKAILEKAQNSTNTNIKDFAKYKLQNIERDERWQKEQEERKRKREERQRKREERKKARQERRAKTGK